MLVPENTLEQAQSVSGSPLQIGQIVAGKYRIERQIGRGGMGIVLAATHLQLEHLVAIKVMRRDLLEDDKAVHRLLLEARSAAKIRSEHVARVLDVGTLDSGSPFIVMEYLEGEDLADLLDRKGALGVEQSVAFMLQCCEALAEVHVAEMVHRDLKPGNLFIARLPDGSPTLKIVDFGISKYIGGGAQEQASGTSTQMLGSPFYMPPEQMRAGPIDARSDIWALGTILFEMLTARPPFLGETLPEVYAAVLNDAPPSIDALRADTPPGLDDVVQRCLEKDPAQRFCDVADLAEALAPFGGPSSGQSVERITRILTNPQPVRARYSAIAAPATNEGSRPGSRGTPRANDPLGHAPELLGRGGGKAERSAREDEDALSLRASVIPAELHPFSATGVGSGDRRPESRPRGRSVWIGVVAAAAVAAVALWARNHEPAAWALKMRTGTASSTLGQVAASTPWAAGAHELSPVADEEPAPPAARKANSGAAIRTSKKALQAAPSRRPSISVAGFRAAVANKKKMSDPSRVGARQRAPKGSPAAQVNTSARAPKKRVASPSPMATSVPRTEVPRGDDAWNPSSFGDRR